MNMLCDLNTLDDRQSAFLERWQMAGGPNAALDHLIGDYTLSMMCCIYSAGEWTYHYVGDEHHKLTGMKLEGAQHNVLSESVAQLAYIRNSKVSLTGEPHRFRSPGAIGETKQLWGERISLPIKPPKGAEQAVLSYYKWNETFTQPALVRAREALFEAIGPDLRELFSQPDMQSPFQQLKTIRGLVKISAPQYHAQLQKLLYDFEDVVYQDERLLLPQSIREHRELSSSIASSYMTAYRPERPGNDNFYLTRHA